MARRIRPPDAGPASGGVRETPPLTIEIAGHHRRHAERLPVPLPIAPSTGLVELGVAAALIVGLSRFLDGPLIWLVALFALAATLFGTLQVLGDADPAGEQTGVPIESLLTPAVAAVAAIGAIRLVPIGPLLLVAAALAALLVVRTASTELRLLTSLTGPTERDRQTVLLEALTVAFLGFIGVAALVPGGLPDPGVTAARPLTAGELGLLAAGDAVIAGLLGYRVAALRMSRLRDVLWSAVTYAAVVAIAAAALRAIDLPRLLGPALLTLVFYLWDAFHGTPAAGRRDPRWIWQTALLVVLAIAVILWNQRLTG